MPDSMPKIVNFELCRSCAHWDELEASDVCNTCLNVAGDIYQRTPINYEEAEVKKEGEIKKEK